MKPYIYSLLLLLLVLPGEIHAQDHIPFSAQGNLRVEFKIDNAPLRESASEDTKSVFVRTYTEVPISYQFYEFIGAEGEEYSEAAALRFREYLASHRTYLQVWKGVPHQNPQLLQQWDISGSFAGVYMYRFPESGTEYFLTIVGECMDATCDIGRTSAFFRNPRSDEAVTYDGFGFRINKELTLYSNLLFLPGIKGSRLYAGECDTCKEKVWEPFGDDDIRKLFLSDDGSSVREDIFVSAEDVIDRVFLTGIYASFTQHLNDMEDSQLVLDYEALAYDWRLSIPDLITKGAEVSDRIYYASTTPNPALQAALKRLGTLSKSGKVSIIAHSNGGLLAKALLQFLGDKQAAQLIDKVVLIGVPQSGAPQALAALLYGYREGIPWQLPLIVSPGVARTFGENSPMAYHLLPSQSLFDSLEYPLIRFSGKHEYSAEQSAYGDAINSFSEMQQFLLASEGGRSKPKATDVEHANVLNPVLLEYASQLHMNLDAWVPPNGIELYQIVGWGVETVTGIEFYEECVLIVCKPKYRPTFSEAGDGVVPAASAHMLDSAENIHTYWIDLREHNTLLHQKDHGTLLEIPEVRDLVEKIVASTSDELPRTISETKPEPSSGKRLRIFLHSPLYLKALNSDGKYTGPAADGSWIEDIPGSEYGVFGEVQFISLPSGEPYTIQLEGYATGTFTLEIQESIQDKVTDEIQYSAIPSTENTIVTLQIEEGVESVSALQIDRDGNGTIDSEVFPNAQQVVEEMPDNPEQSDKPRPPQLIRTRESVTPTPVPINEYFETITAPAAFSNGAAVPTSHTEQLVVAQKTPSVERPMGFLQHLIQLLLKLVRLILSFLSV